MWGLYGSVLEFLFFSMNWFMYIQRLLMIFRPLAYSTLADLVHHVRQELSYAQLQSIVQLYTRNMHDASLPLNIQIMSAKIVLNLVEAITRRNDPESNGM